MSNGRSFTTSFLTKYNASALSQFSKQLKDLKSEMSDNKREQKALSKEIRDAQKEINAINAEVKRTEQVTKEQQKRLDELTASIKTDKDELEKLKLQQAQIQSKIDDTNKAIENQKKAFSELTTSMSSAKAAGADLAKQIATITAAVTAGVAGIFAYTKGAAQWADDINTLAKVTGIGTDELQKFMYATDLIDVSVDTLSGSLAKLTRNMAEPSKAAAAAFDTLKIKVTDSTGALRDRQEVFYEVIDALGKVGNETERDALAMDIFGKSAQELNPLIMGGAQALKEIGDQAERAGLILSQDALNGLNAFNDKVDALKAKGEAIKNLAASEMTPALDGLLDVADELLDDINEMVQSGELKNIAAEIGKGIKEAANALKNIIKFVWEYRDAIGAAVKGMIAFKLAMSISNVVTSAVNVIKALTSAATAAATATVALGASISKLSAAGAAISVVIGLTTALVSLYNAEKDSTEVIDEYNRKVEAAKEKAEAYTSALRDLQERTDSGVSSAKAEGEVLKVLQDEYDTLRKRANLTAEEKNRLTEISGKLASQLGLTTSQLRDQTGAYKDLSGEIDIYLDKLIKQAKYEHYEDTIKEAVNSYDDLTKKLEEHNIQLGEARIKLVEMEKEYEKQGRMSRDKNGFYSFDAEAENALKKQREVIGELEREQNAYEKEIEKVGKVLEETKKEYQDYIKTVENSGKAVDDAGEETEKAAEKAADLSKELDSLKSKSSSLRSEMSSLASSMQQLEEGQALTLDTVLDLIDKYPELGAELLAAGDNADLQRMALEKLFEAKKADYILTQQKAIDNIDASNRETEATIKDIEQQIKMYQMLGSIGAAVNMALHPEMKIGDALFSALNPLVMSAELTGLQAQLDRNNAIKAGLESKIAAARSMNYSDLYKPSSSGSGSGGSSGMTAEEKRLSEAQSLALAAYKKLVDGKIELYEKESKAAKDSADKQIAALDAVIKKRNEEKEDAKRQQELAVINAKLTYKQLDDFTRHELERRKQDILNEQYDVNYSRNIEAQKAALSSGATAIQDRNAQAIAGLNAMKTQFADRIAYINGSQTYDQRVANNSKSVNVTIVQNGLNGDQVLAKLLKEIGV